MHSTSLIPSRRTKKTRLMNGDYNKAIKKHCKNAERHEGDLVELLRAAGSKAQTLVYARGQEAMLQALEYGATLTEARQALDTAEKACYSGIKALVEATLQTTRHREGG